jgi:DNA/RNA endonuclease YhcR with UshA esterase domain
MVYKPRQARVSVLVSDRCFYVKFDTEQQKATEQSIHLVASYRIIRRSASMKRGYDKNEVTLSRQACFS